MVNVRFQFCLATESIGQDIAILPDDQLIKVRKQGKMGSHLINYHYYHFSNPYF